MNSPEIKLFIKENSSIFWYVKESEKENISHEVLVEFILNYGDKRAVKKLFALLNINKVAEIFYSQISRERVNYFEPVRNFFDLYFKHHVSSGNPH